MTLQEILDKVSTTNVNIEQLDKVIKKTMKYLIMTL